MEKEKQIDGTVESTGAGQIIGPTVVGRFLSACRLDSTEVENVNYSHICVEVGNRCQILQHSLL